jgi:ParB family chromosome partitioning protein
MEASEVNRKRGRGLGRGLGALIPDAAMGVDRDGDRVVTVPLDAIEPNPVQPRRDFDLEELDALADSIREQGLLQPVVLRMLGNDVFQLIAGERRWRAAARAGLDRIPAIIRETRDDEMLPLAMIENLLREDLNPIEEALAFHRLSQESNWTQEEIGQRVGKSRVHVANTLRLLKLPEAIRADVASSKLSTGHARAILACEGEEAMFALRDRILSQNLTVREAEEGPVAARAARGPRAKPTPRKRGRDDRSISPELRDLEERLQRVFGTPVQIHERTGRGRLSLEFYSYEDLDRLTELLMRADPHA